MADHLPYYRQIREGVLVALPRARYPDASINQYEAPGNNYDRIAALHEQLNVVGKPERFRAVLYHFSEPRTSLSALTAEKEELLLSQWTFYASDVGDSYCICSQPHIRDLRYIRNVRNNNVLLVGNECLEKLPENSVVRQTTAAFTQEAKKTDTCRHCTLTMERSDFNYVGVCRGCESQETPMMLSQLRRYCTSCTNPRVIKEEKGVCDRCYAEGKRLCDDCGDLGTIDEKRKKTKFLCSQCIRRRNQARKDEQKRIADLGEQQRHATLPATQQIACTACRSLFSPRASFHTRCDQCFFAGRSVTTSSSTPETNGGQSHCESCKNRFKPLQSGHKRCYACYMKSNSTPEQRRCDGCNREFEPLRAHYRLCSSCSYDRFTKK